ncbi:unnamed protein product [Orchesella dallaii]|uniref:Uncharacterized protein n=1 Tax=Orchesella dallaii TaxID=48710 RepID=A0ABP1RYE2_9HEXA
MTQRPCSRPHPHPVLKSSSISSSSLTKSESSHQSIATYSPGNGHPKVSAYPRAVAPIYPKQYGSPGAPYSPASSRAPAPYPSQYGAHPSAPSHYGAPAAQHSPPSSPAHYPSHYGAPAAQYSPPSSPTHYPSHYGPPPSHYGAPAAQHSPPSSPTHYPSHYGPPASSYGAPAAQYSPPITSSPAQTPRQFTNTGAGISVEERECAIAGICCLKFQQIPLPSPQSEWSQLSSTPSQDQPGVYYTAVPVAVSYPQYTGPPRQFAGGVGQPGGFTENERSCAISGLTCIIITVVVICLVITILPFILFFVVFQKVEKEIGKEHFGDWKTPKPPSG